ncbi:SIMPL domain-containing protein [Bacillus andreraoultii]|uniref:SIMPL domain-containing protein n=1 Tax=Bacillus andreraoultii TaxID=1499685 RepID=UPI0005AAE4E0|nr:SIMPL domain-containing protein [Bacillus andreraoultii]
MYAYQPNQKMITVTGEGKIAVEPNLAIITMGIVTENKSLQAAQSENSERSAKVIQTLFAQQINRNDIQTVEYRIDRLYDFVEGKQVFRAYEVRHLIEVRVRDISQIGSIVDSAVTAGVNTINNIRFDYENKSASYDQALRLALKDAQRKANVIASEAGGTFRPIPIEIMEGKQGVVPVPFQSFATEKVAGVSTPIEPGTMQIEAALIVKFMFG